MNLIVFLGPAGSGKGTQASFLKDELKYVHLSTGDLLREEVSSQSDVGKIVSDIINRGDLVSDELIIKIIKSKLDRLLSESTPPGIIFDGFPRTKDQAISLDSLISKYNFSLSNVFYFDLNLDESINRISGRLIDPRDNSIYHKTFNPPPDDVKPFVITRDDDSPDKVRHRFLVYQESTEPLLDYYNDRLIRIDCMLSIDQINSSIIKSIETIPIV